MSKGDHEFRRKPKGSRNGGYVRPRVQIGFDKDKIAEIAKLAKVNNRSFAAEVRSLVDQALRVGQND
jgi:hypothetical protein